MVAGPAWALGLIYLLDTSVAIHLRDGNESVQRRVKDLDGRVCLSLLTRIELESGAVRGNEASLRRDRLDVILSIFETLPMDVSVADRYREIIEAAGYARARVLDRMIAAHALALEATVVTMNGKDFSDIPALKLLAW